MEDFKKLPKMQCFKTGGVVNAMCGGGKAYKEGRHVESEEMKEDVKQDKAIVKKAFKMHEEQQHEGEKTDLSKLKKGGRMKKDAGTVRKYKTGGTVIDNKPGSQDPLKKVKPTAKKATAPSKAAMLPAAKGVVDAFKKGGKIKKMADGALSAPMPQGAVSDTEKLRLANRARNRAMLGPAQQRELDAQEAAAAAAAAQGGMGGGLGGIGRKKGGKACQ